MKLRHKRWNYLTALAPAVIICSSGRRYISSNVNDGVFDVPYARDVEDILHPLGDVACDYQIAYEEYGLKVKPSGEFEPIEETEKGTEDAPEREDNAGSKSGHAEKEPASKSKPGRGRKKVGK